MDYLKRDAPFWKFEKSRGESSWVTAKEAEDRAEERWKTV
jgi:molybdopterin synthase catalytic subunit